MSDVSKTIAEARKKAEWYGETDLGPTVNALADALEAATRVPVQGEPECECWPTEEKYHFVHFGATEPGSAFEYNPECPEHGEPNDDREALRDEFRSYLGDEIYVCSRDYSAWTHGTMGFDDFSLASEDDEVIESLVQIASRATVPDAATERVGYLEAERDTADEYAFFARQTLAEVEEERDAALAAVERVWAVADHWSSDEDAKGLHFDLVAALDGAPEPEGVWEYSVGFNDPECGWINDNADIHDSYEDARSDYSEPNWLVEDRVVRRRKAGPWLPVEGESK